MKITLFCLIFFATALVAGQEKNQVTEKRINNTSELKVWCRNKSSEYLLSQDLTPYNWTSSWWSKGEYLFVKGEWRVGVKKFPVKCHVRRGLAESYASWEFIQR